MTYGIRHLLLSGMVGAVLAHGTALWLVVPCANAVPPSETNLGFQSAPRRYPALVTRVVDGDTLVADVDLGFHTIRTGVHVRLLGIDAPERNTTNGIKAKQHMEELVAQYDRDKGEDGWQFELQIEADKTDSFGRTLAKVVGRSGTDLGAKMLADGFAEPYEAK